MRGKLGDRVRLNHIFDAIIEVESYLVNADFDIFLNKVVIENELI